jgi:hypothetical protein
MTFEEAEKTLPNGFHDAKIVRIVLDYASNALLMTLQILVGTPGQSDQEQYGTAELRANGLHFCFIDPPDPSYPFKPNGKPLGVSGAPESRESPVIEGLSAKLPEGASVYRFFADRWNSFIHVAASDIQISWDRNGRVAESLQARRS